MAWGHLGRRAISFVRRRGFEGRTPASKRMRNSIMRKLTAIITALGFLGSTALTPVIAAPALAPAAKSDDLSAAKKKKKKKGAEMTITQDEMTGAKKKKKKKGAELTITQDEMTGAKKKKKKKGAELILYRIAA
jgi:hypothetical protein